MVIYGFSHIDGDTTFNFQRLNEGELVTDDDTCMLVSVSNPNRNAVREIKIPEEVVDNEGLSVRKVSKIDKMAFAGFTSLKDLYIPETVKEIHCDAFLFGSDKITVHSQKGSCAEIWAKSKGFDFIKDSSNLNKFLNDIRCSEEQPKGIE